MIDHIDKDGTNNRWNNLRAATRAQNLWNRGAWRGRELPKGVTRNKARWAASIWTNRKRHHLGTFDTIEEAKAAYDAACLRLHGEFANLG